MGMFRKRHRQLADSSELTDLEIGCGQVQHVPGFQAVQNMLCISIHPSTLSAHTPVLQPNTWAAISERHWEEKRFFKYCYAYHYGCPDGTQGPVNAEISYSWISVSSELKILPIFHTSVLFLITIFFPFSFIGHCSCYSKVERFLSYRIAWRLPVSMPQKLLKKLKR